MDDEDERSLGSRKSTEPAGVSFKQWTKILDVQVDANGLAVPGTLVPTDPPQIPVVESLGEDRDLIISSGANRAAVEARTHGVGRGLGGNSSDEFEIVGSNPLARRGDASTGIRKASLYDRANNPIIALPNTSQDGAVPGMEDLEPPLIIGVKTHKSCGGSAVSGGMVDHSPRICANNPEVRADREVIVAKESFDMDLEGVANPAPLGYTRRPSLFQRFNIKDAQQRVAQPVEWAETSHETGVMNTVKDKGIDSVGLEEGKEQYTWSLGHGTYNTVLRDWLMHVLEKDDQHDTKEVQNIWAAARRRRRLAHKTFEAADYELYDSKVWHMHKAETIGKTRHGAKDLKRNRKHMTRLLTVGLGIAVGLSGCFVTFFTESVIEAKLHFIADVLEHHEGESGFRRFGSAFGWFWFLNTILASGAFGLVVLNPWSAGSGIPETKCVLNGVSIPQVLAPSTLACKLVGVVLGVASGLPLGKEGPMIHAGAAIGGSIASLPRVKALSAFCNDRDRRDFAAIGTAAGVAAAFRTPIGGVLFTIEEGASFWSTILTWRSFAAAVVTVVVYYLVFQGRHMLDHPLVAEDIFIFGEFRDEDSNFYMWELTVFAIIATLGGLVGALFVACNKRLDLFRARHLSGPRRRFVELLCVCTLSSVISFFLPLVVGECREIPTDVEDWTPAGLESLHHLVALNCHDGYYNELGSLFLNEQDRVIKLLFHFGTPGLRPATVLLFAVVFLVMECITLGMWVCSGLFIPSLLVGAAMGRGFGRLLGRNSRAYALIGAAGVLGGIVRTTLSLTVMMVEASGWVLFVIPLMLVFITARSVGNRFNEGIYDTKIHIKKMPFLEQEPPEETRAQNMRAYQLMSKELVCLRPIETVSAVISALRDYDHNCFPVVEGRDQRVLLGTVHRKNLLVLLKHRHFTASSAQDPTRPDQSLPELSWDTLESSYPNYPKVHELKVREHDMECLMDLAAYVQIGPHVINEHASAQRAYIMFRTLGLRHLVVINHYNEVMGMITRENLLSEHFEKGGAYHSAEGSDSQGKNARDRRVR